MSNTPIYLDTEVVAEVMRLSGIGSPQAAVDAAVREYVNNRRRTHERTENYIAEVRNWQPTPPAPPGHQAGY